MLMERVYLGIGSNLGDRTFHLQQAKALIHELPNTRFLRSSSIHETDPVGGPPQGKYLNAVWEIETALPPKELKERLREIEEKLGRKRVDPKNAPRPIDLDILFYGDQVVAEDDLKIPHPRLHERAFVLEPLFELIPDFIHPLFKESVKELLQNLPRARA